MEDSSPDSRSEWRDPLRVAAACGCCCWNREASVNKIKDEVAWCRIYIDTTYPGNVMPYHIPKKTTKLIKLRHVLQIRNKNPKCMMDQWWMWTQIRTFDHFEEFVVLHRTGLKKPRLRGRGQKKISSVFHAKSPKWVFPKIGVPPNHPFW